MIRGVIINSALLITLSALTLCTTCAQIDGSSPPESSTTKQLLEPIVKRHVGILPPDVCKELIRLGEEDGFTVEHESIDNYEEGYTVPSQSIEIFERDGEFWEMQCMVERRIAAQQTNTHSHFLMINMIQKDGITSPAIW